MGGGLVDTRWHALTATGSQIPAAPGRVPTATYRWQFHAGFTFAQATDLVAYLADLGISHCYASPYFKARPGSIHGYDIADHDTVNPEIGSETDRRRFIAVLHDHGMGQVIDIVPNHMSAIASSNAWWWDVLENGEASSYARYFDIDWHSSRRVIDGKVLLPILGGQYGKVLESGLIQLAFERQTGGFSIHYFEHVIPIDPATYPIILSYDPARLESVTDESLRADMVKLLDNFAVIPKRTRISNGDERNAACRRAREGLATVASVSSVANYIDDIVTVFNGRAGIPSSFDPLHNLLEQQAYRLASWRVASYEINYRRFFDINELVALRTEDEVVFEAIHRQIMGWIVEGAVQGLRIDHPDGLRDPAEYYRRLIDIMRAAGRPPILQGKNTVRPGLYVIVEKILGAHEQLPRDWQVDGTTGYDFTALVNGLLVDQAGEAIIDDAYSTFTRNKAPLVDLLYECKQLVMRSALSGEMNVLASVLDRISEADRCTRDFTKTALASALFQIVACFPVYRTYATCQAVSVDDESHIRQAVALAKVRSGANDLTVFDFIQSLLLFEGRETWDAAYMRAAWRFASGFQQYTAPVMAKSLEDTLFYRYNRLTSLNEVGGDPGRFGATIGEFHAANTERRRLWPNTMLCTSSHDTKRSEDARARITVLSELAIEWGVWLRKWSHMNRAFRRSWEGQTAPDSEDEYLFYQALIGIWPAVGAKGRDLSRIVDRIEHYMIKAICEAKVNTSWINRDGAYEEAVTTFIRKVLAEGSAFLANFRAVTGRLVQLGLLNSLSQTLLKLTVPGVPDVYQGTEIWDFSLVDPDNRRPVDYMRRQFLLDRARTIASMSEEERAKAVRGLGEGLSDGLAKLFLTRQILRWRRAHAALFTHGDYVPLYGRGSQASHVVAFARRHEGTIIIVVAPRCYAAITDPISGAFLGPEPWADTWLEVVAGGEGCYENLLTGQRVTTSRDGRPSLRVAELVGDFPVAVLHNQVHDGADAKAVETIGRRS
ncbi:MAG: malto-oligosyltrehalose synthase [Acidiferrobacter sp.]